jgi:hypothetical protein
MASRRCASPMTNDVTHRMVERGVGHHARPGEISLARLGSLILDHPSLDHPSEFHGTMALTHQAHFFGCITSMTHAPK